MVHLVLSHTHPLPSQAQKSMKTRLNPFLRIASSLAAIMVVGSAQAEILSFDGNQATGVTTHTINATDRADYVGGSTTFNSVNAGGRLYWRGAAGDGQYMHFDLSSLTGLTLVAPVTVTLQDANPTWGGGVTGSFVATANTAWTATAGGTVPTATPITNALNPTGSYGWDAAISWGIGHTTFQNFITNQASFHGLAVIGGPGSQMHFDAGMNPFLTVQTGTLSTVSGVITADTGASTWNASNYSFAGSSDYSPTANTLTITGALIEGTSGAGTVTINNGGTVAVSQAGSTNFYWAIDATTINAGGKLTSNGHSNLRSLTLVGGELASTGTDVTLGGWGLQDVTTVNGGVTSTISAQQVSLSSGVFEVEAGSTLNFTGSTRNTANALTKNGDGAMRFSGWQSYTGGTTVNGGTLELAGQNSGNGWLRGAVRVNPGATLSMTGGDGTGFGWNSSVTSVTIDGGTLAANSSHLGFGNYATATLSNGGTISGNWQWNGDGGLGFSSSGDATNTISGNLVLRPDSGANHTFNVADGAAEVDLLVSANLSDQSPEIWWVPASALTKTGAGTMVLSGTNSYNGATTVSAGTLSISSPYLDNTAAVTIAADAKMDLNFTGEDIVGSLRLGDSGSLPADTYNASHPTYGSFFTGTGSLVVLGASGTWSSLTGGNWSDTANWASGAVAAGANSTATFNTASGGTVTVDSVRRIGNLVFDVSDFTLAGSSTLTLEATGMPYVSVGTNRTVTISAPLAGLDGLEKQGAGTLVLQGVKSYTGGTTVTSGTLELNSTTGNQSAVRGTLTVNSGATVNITGSDYAGLGRTGGANVTELNVNGGTINNSVLSWLTNCTTNLTGATISGGNFHIISGSINSKASDNSSTISSGLTIRKDYGSSDLTLNVEDGAATTDLLISGNIGQVFTAGVSKSGPGTLQLTGTNGYLGDTVVSEGALDVTSTGSLSFKPTFNGITNKVSGTSSATLNFQGTVALDLTGAVISDGNSWFLFDLATFTGTTPTLTPTAVTSGSGSFAETSPGSGVWELNVTGAKWTFTTADGKLTYTITASPYDLWANSYNLVGGAADDDDADGLTNFEEYAFGLIPNSAASVNPITQVLDKNAGTFSYQRLKASGLTYTVETSTDLVTWTQDASAEQNATDIPNTQNENVVVTLSATKPLTEAKLFIRVKAL